MTAGPEEEGPTEVWTQHRDTVTDNRGGLGRGGFRQQMDERWNETEEIRPPSARG